MVSGIFSSFTFFFFFFFFFLGSGFKAAVFQRGWNSATRSVMNHFAHFQFYLTVRDLSWSGPISTSRIASASSK